MIAVWLVLCMRSLIYRVASYNEQVSSHTLRLFFLIFPLMDVKTDSIGNFRSCAGTT
jgi:hypothetical protein